MTGRWIDVGSEASVVGTQPLTAEVDGFAVVVVRCPEGYFAVEDRCTHDGEPRAGAAVDACQNICPRHGARFCLTTGEALSPPAYEPVRTFEVRAEKGRLLLQLPD